MGVVANNLPVATSESNRTRSESIVKRMSDMLLTTFIRHRSMTIRFWKASVIGISLVSAFLLRFDFSIPAMEIRHLKVGLLIALLTKLSIFYLLGLDRGWWRFTGINESAIARYLVTLYTSLAVLTDDALAVLDGVAVDRFHEYK